MKHIIIAALCCFVILSSLLLAVAQSVEEETFRTVQCHQKGGEYVPRRDIEGICVPKGSVIPLTISE